jgi:pyruvate dehydrogenase E2 component (dihydrolipoamide acetyltransferase)
VDFVFQDEGYIAKFLVKEGAEDVAVGSPVCIVVDEASEIAAAQASAGSASSKPAAAAAPAPKAPVVAAAAAPSPAPSVAGTLSAQPSAGRVGGRIVASPYARKLAEAAGIDLSAISGTGPDGRIIAADVTEYKPALRAPTTDASNVRAAAFSSAQSSAQTSSSISDARSGFQDIPHSSMRRVIAHRLLQSKQTVPHYYLTSEIQMDALLALRVQLNADLPADAKLSVNDFLVKASALACKKVPEVNSSWMDSVVRAYDYVDVAVAVAVPDGLVTPIVRDAHTKGLSSISSGVKSLVEKARAKKLAPEDYQGGTFTVSNLGMFGVKQFSAIINPPQAAILAVGSAERRVIPGADANSPLKQAVFMSATLSCDHRVVDGAVGAQWLAAFKDFMEHPTKMLL